MTQRPTAPVPAAGVVDERSYEFLTPVFGGGVRVEGPRKHRDPVTPVRAPSIRGQLRFWWRAVNPRGCATVDALREAEAEVFGAASVSSKDALDVAVIEQPRSHRELRVMVPGDKFKTEQGMESIGYGAFPLRDPDAAAHGVLHEHGGAWKVRFRYGEEVRDDVEAALWAWAHFGGLGGRTRRGFGAVKQTSPGLPSLDEGWARWIAKPGRPEAVAWPALRADRATWLAVAARPFTSALEAQKHLLGELRRLRQGPLGRNPKSANEPRRPGRSYWPEADAIRAATGTSELKHRQRVTQGDAFPRSAFGMPIVFFFKDHHDPQISHLLPAMNETRGNKVELKPLGRLASPLLLRPRATAQGVEALALVLLHPAFDALVLDKSGVSAPQRAAVTAKEAAALRPLQAPDRPPFTDPLLRYLHLVRTGQ